MLPVPPGPREPKSWATSTMRIASNSWQTSWSFLISGESRVHGEESFRDYENAVFLVLLTDLLQNFTSVLYIQVPVKLHIGCRRVGPLLEAVMGERVHVT